MKKAILTGIFGSGLAMAQGQTLQITGNPPVLSITNGTQLVNGVQASHQTVTVVNPALGIVAVQLYVRCSGNLASGGNSIPASSVGILVTSPTSTPDPERFLSTANQRILSYQPPLIGLFSTPVTIRYRLTGGSSFFRPAGTYTTTITYTLTAD